MALIGRRGFFAELDPEALKLAVSTNGVSFGERSELDFDGVDPERLGYLASCGPCSLTDVKKGRARLLFGTGNHSAFTKHAEGAVACQCFNRSDLDGLSRGFFVPRNATFDVQRNFLADAVVQSGFEIVEFADLDGFSFGAFDAFHPVAAPNTDLFGNGTRKNAFDHRSCAGRAHAVKEEEDEDRKSRVENRTRKNDERALPDRFVAERTVLEFLWHFFARILSREFYVTTQWNEAQCVFRFTARKL